MAESQTRIWISELDHPEITREDHQVMICVPGDHSWEIILDPSVFPALLEAIGRAGCQCPEGMKYHALNRVPRGGQVPYTREELEQAEKDLSGYHLDNVNIRIFEQARRNREMSE